MNYDEPPEAAAAPSEPEPKLVHMSRAQAKRLRNMTTGLINASTSSMQRTATELSAELNKLRNYHANMMVALEAIILRHGTQVFRLDSIPSDCRGNRVYYEVDTETLRLTVKLRDQPMSADLLDKKAT